jgi:rubrerythrin
MSTLFGALRKAQSIEAVASSVYRAAAKRFASDPHWADMFRRLAEEEAQHALRVKMLATRLSRDREAAREAVLAEADLDALLHDGQTLLQRIEGPGDLLLADVLALLRDMEAGFASVHAHALVATGDPASDELFAQLAAQDRAHLAMLTPEA